MRIRPKTIRRLTLLAIVAVIVGALGVGAIFFRRVQRQNSIDALRTEALASYAKADYADALPQLAQYVRYRKDDPETLLALARSRRAVETGDGSHLLQTANALRAYRLLKPDDLVAAADLLELYNMVEAFPEAQMLSKELLERQNELSQAQVIDFKLARATALLGTNPNDREAADLIKDVAGLAPTNFEAQRRYLDALLQASPAEACDYATSLVSSHSDPRLVFLQAVACDDLIADGRGLSPQTAQTVRDVIEQADDVVLQDDAFVTAVLRFAERTRDGRLTVATLKRAAENARAGSGWAVLYIRKLYQLDRFAEAAREAERLLAGADRSDVADLRAYVVLCKRAEGAEIPGGSNTGALTETAEALAAESRSSFRFKGWNLALTGVAALDEGKLVYAEEKFAEACKAYPGEPLIRLLLGDVLSRLERSEDARTAWSEASNLTRTPWPSAELRIVRSLLRSGQTRAALDAASTARANAPDRVSVYLGWLEACNAHLLQGMATGEERAEAQAIIDSLDSNFAEADPEFRGLIERTMLPVRITLALAAGTEPELSSLLEQPHVRAALSDPDVSAQVATLLINAGLEVPSLVSQALDASATPDPRLAKARALQLAREGKPADGASLLNTPAGADELTWAIARAEFAELAATTPDETRAATKQWADLLGKYPDSLTAASAVLRSATAPYDAALIESAAAALARLANASGSAPSALVVLARAQAVSLGTPTAKQRDAAIGSLEQLIAREPTNLGARVVLTNLYMLNNPSSGVTADPTRAAVHLLSASELIGGARADAMRLQSAEFFQLTRDFGRARDALFRMLDASDTSNPELLWDAGRSLLAQGEPEMALRLLARAEVGIPAEQRASVLVDIGRAREASADDSRARQAYEQATTLGLRRASEVLTVAAFYARIGQDDQSKRAMESLESLDLPDGNAELARARYAELIQQPEQAAYWYEQSLERSPYRPDAWERLGRLRLSAGNREGAQAAVRSGLALYPDDPPLRILDRQLLAAQTGGEGEVDLQTLADVYSGNPATSRTAEAIRALATLEATGKISDRQSLISIAQEYPEILPLQNLIGRRLMDPDVGAAADAGPLMLKAAEYFPADPEPARLATLAFASVGNFEQMQAAALLWRRRDPTQARFADLAIAESAYQTRQGTRAAEIVARYLDDALAAPADDTNLQFLQLWVRMNASQGTLDQVQARLIPALSEDNGDLLLSAVWLTAVADMIPDWPTAQRWLDAAEPRATEPAQIAQLVDACCARAHAGLPDVPGALARAVRYAEPLRSSTDSTVLKTLAELDLLRSNLLRAQGAPSEADTIARGAIRSITPPAEVIDPLVRADRFIVAALIAESIPDLDLAVECYRSAVSVSNAPDQLRAAAHNNLAYCLWKRRQPGDAPQALAEADKALSVMRLPAFLHTKAQILQSQGNTPEAITVLREAIARDPNSISAISSLASILAGGDESAKQEARNLLTRADLLSRTNVSAAVAEEIALTRRTLSE